MKTLFNNILNNRLQHAGNLAITAMLALVMVVAALPQPALAATPCVAHYTVKSGDTKSKIAHIYGLPWSDIAMANNMKSDANIKVGQSLCIPSKKPPSPTQTGTMTASASGNIVHVIMSGFDTRYIWNVNVSDTRKTTGVVRIGRMKVPANTTVSGAFKLPQELRQTPFLMVCVKNVTTGDKICRNIAHTL